MRRGHKLLLMVHYFNQKQMSKANLLIFKDLAFSCYTNVVH